MEFQGLGRRAVIGKFDGGQISSDGGGLLLRELESRTGILKRLAGCFLDKRDQGRVEHALESLLKQRIFGIALGYEDLNDHDRLRHDPLFGLMSEKEDPVGSNRRHEADKGKALAGKSTLNRLELTPGNVEKQDRYKKLWADFQAMDSLLVALFLEAHKEAPEEIVIDVDATDDPLHGSQEGRFFHGYYGHYCYLPLYFFCGEHLLCARLREANQDGAAGTVEELSRIVGQIRQSWPDTKIILRGDSGFCREEIMLWCEANKVDYVLGLAKNARLKQAIAAEMAEARKLHKATGKAARVFRDFGYQTLKSWSCERRVVGKAEYLIKGENPRFIVTSLCKKGRHARALYEELYCARGDMENRIKEQQLALFADRTSTRFMRSNQVRLYFSSFAYVLVQTLRRLGLKGTEEAHAQCDTIRLKLFKLGVQLRVTVRKIWLSFSEGYPYETLFLKVFERLRQIPQHA